MSNDGKDEGELRKRCPFNNEWCGDWCPLLVEITRRNPYGGVIVQKTCVFVASNLMISEINMKTSPPTQKMKLPSDLLIKGG